MAFFLTDAGTTGNLIQGNERASAPVPDGVTPMWQRTAGCYSAIGRVQQCDWAGVEWFGARGTLLPTTRTRASSCMTLPPSATCSAAIRFMTTARSASIWLAEQGIPPLLCHAESSGRGRAWAGRSSELSDHHHGRGCVWFDDHLRHAQQHAQPRLFGGCLSQCQPGSIGLWRGANICRKNNGFDH